MPGMQRICVVGSSGSGKTTFAAALARKLRLRHIELDSIYHQPGWTELHTDEFRRRVGLATDEGGWVVDGNYANHVQDILWNRADTILWLDLPRSLVVRRVIKRTLGRVALRRELWNGNRERWRNVLSRDPLKSVIAWSWTHHGKYIERYAAAMTDPGWNRLRFVRLTSPNEIARFLKDARSAAEVSERQAPA